MAHGTADDVVPPGGSEAVLDRVAGPRWLLTLTGVGPLAPFQGAARGPDPSNGPCWPFDGAVARRSAEDPARAAVPGVAEVRRAG